MKANSPFWWGFPIALFFTLTSSLFAQTDLSELEGFSRGRLSTTGGYQFKFNSFSLQNNEVHIKQVGSTTSTAFSLVEVASIEKQTGNQALLGAITIGGSALLGSLLGIAEVSSDPYTKLDSQVATNLTIGMTLGGALIGALVGTGFKKYKTVYKNQGFSLNNLQIGLSRSLVESSQIRLRYAF